MPDAEVIYYCDDDGTAPVIEWLLKLSKNKRKAAEKCLVRIETLRQLGHELRRPIADYLRDGIYESARETEPFSTESSTSFTARM